MSRSRTRKKPMAQMNVVPYIDVMLVLLVIFMVTAPMMQTGVQVDLPDAEAESLESDNQEEPLIVSVDQEGRFYLEDDTEVKPDEIAVYVTDKVATNPKRQVYVKAATDVEYNYVMQAMVAIQEGGAQSIGLMADPVPVEQ